MSTPSKLSVGALVLVASLSASAAWAQDANGPFAGLEGAWTGSGTATLANGGTERLRCEAAYDVAPSGQSLRQDLRCRSDSYAFDLRTSVDHQGGALSGTWVEVTRNARGNLSGQVSPGQIRATAQGPGFAAGIGLATRGNQQSVTIRSQGTEVTQVSMVLRKTGARAAASP